MKNTESASDQVLTYWQFMVHKRVPGELQWRKLRSRSMIVRMGQLITSGLIYLFLPRFPRSATLM